MDSNDPGGAQESQATLLFCRMCQAVYRQPKLLPCLHSFCRPCIVNAVSHTAAGGTVVVCPQCSYQAKLPPNGIVGIPDNPLLNRLCQVRLVLGFLGFYCLYFLNIIARLALRFQNKSLVITNY